MTFPAMDESEAVLGLVEWYLGNRRGAEQWARRDRYLGTSAEWNRRSRWSRDVRTSATDAPFEVPVEAKRRYQWAETSWLGGYLSPRAFLDEGRAFDLALIQLQERRPFDRPLDTEEQIAKEERRLRKLGRESYVNRPGWARLGEAMRAYRDRRTQWEQRQLMAQETRRQRRLLREGQQTLQAIRLYLRGAASLQQLASRQETTSPTS